MNIILRQRCADLFLRVRYASYTKRVAFVRIRLICHAYVIDGRDGTHRIDAHQIHKADTH